LHMALFDFSREPAARHGGGNPEPSSTNGMNVVEKVQRLVG
jgi:hypothetical protein